MVPEWYYQGVSEGEDPSLVDGKTYKFEVVCRCCSKLFRTNSPQKQFCNRQHYLPCPICGKLVKKNDKDFTRQPTCCSSECSHEMRKKHLPHKVCILCGKTFSPNTGVGCICEDIHYRNCEVCGKLFEIDRKDPKCTTCSKECAAEKTRKFYHEKYGCNHPMQNPEVRKHHQEAMKIKYGETHALKVKKFVEKQQETVVKTNMQRYGVPYACLLPQNIETRPEQISKKNREASKYLEDNLCKNNLEVPIGRYSYDIVVPTSRIAIEIDPSYTHSVLPNHWRTAVSVDYHLKKTQLAQEYGYKCIHIFDWDNMNKVLNMCIPRKSIYARNCTIYKLNPDTARKFIEENDIKGNCRGQLFFLGLVSNNELYQVMSFGKPRYSKSHDVELMRICTRIGYQVLGGASRLFKFATQNYGLNNIVAYCDISKYTGELFEILNMKLVRQTPPQEIWSKHSKYITANLLRQKGAEHLLQEKYNAELDNEENLIADGWLPVYDCGMKVFEFV